MTNIWVGLHDHADQKSRWVDPRVSYSWLRAFELCHEGAPSAYLREPQYNSDSEHPIRNVRYHFRATDIPNWADDIIAEDPTLIMYNCCYYAAGARTAEHLRDSLKDAIHVIRIHHQVTYLAMQPGFREFLLACDVAIAPTEEQIKAVRDLGFTGPVYALPFGISAEPMRQAAQPFESRDIQLASATNSHPARNLALVEQVYKNLRQRGRRVENFTGLTPGGLAERLGRTKIFWQTSMTEASGSRVLPEAMAAGCFPVVFDECTTTRDLIRAHNTGISLNSGIVYDYRQKTTTYPAGIVEHLTDELDRIIGEVEAKGQYEAPPLAVAYEESHEVERLAVILRESVTLWRKPRANWRRWMHLPVDPDGYAFNPTIFKTPAGLVCIYRHVGADGIRTLRRCLLNADFRAAKYTVWSDEVKKLGSDVEWYADPRAFQAGADIYISFNTGWSETQNQIYLVKVDANGAPVTRPIKVIKPDGRKNIEKNWGFFYQDGDIYAIYSIAPFIVLRLEFVGDTAIARPVASHAWNSGEIEARFGELHGGAAPVIIGDRGYYVAQSSSDSVVGRIYRGTLITFEAKPPFRPLAVAPEPLFALSIDEMCALPQTRLNPPVTQCLYPCGAMHEPADASLTICYGINDYRAGSRNYDLDRLEEAMRPVMLIGQSDK